MTAGAIERTASSARRSPTTGRRRRCPRVPASSLLRPVSRARRSARRTRRGSSPPRTATARPTRRTPSSRANPSASAQRGEGHEKPPSSAVDRVQADLGLHAEAVRGGVDGRVAEDVGRARGRSTRRARRPGRRRSRRRSCPQPCRRRGRRSRRSRAGDVRQDRAAGSATFAASPARRRRCSSKAATRPDPREPARRVDLERSSGGCVSITSPGLSTYPMTLEPLPRATQGTPWRAQRRTTACASATVAGQRDRPRR